MDSDVEIIYSFFLSKHNSGSYSKVYTICCEVVDSLNELGITNRRSKKPFKYPKPERHNPARHSLRGCRYSIKGRLHKKLSNMVKETWIHW